MQVKKITRKILFSFAALSFLAVAALPAGAQVALSEGCTLVKDLNVNIAIKDGNNSVSQLKQDFVVNSATSSGNILDADGTPYTIPTTGPISLGATSTSIANKWGIICLMNTINTIINWISIIVLILSTALIIYAGFLWMTGGDNPENKEKAGKVILAALIGFGIVILARVLPAVVSGILL